MTNLKPSLEGCLFDFRLRRHLSDVFRPHLSSRFVNHPPLHLQPRAPLTQTLIQFHSLSWGVFPIAANQASKKKKKKTELRNGIKETRF